MSCYKGVQHDEWFASTPVTREHGATFRLNNLMSGKRFCLLQNTFVYTDKVYPTYTDRFHKIRQFVKAWNANMTRVFRCGWVDCLDESMMVWLSRWTCPGWMVVPRKPHSFGNEWHTICCGQCGILFFMEIVEGIARPAEAPP